jgi:hypothetical protein
MLPLPALLQTAAGAAAAEGCGRVLPIPEIPQGLLGLSSVRDATRVRDLELFRSPGMSQSDYCALPPK